MGGNAALISTLLEALVKSSEEEEDDNESDEDESEGDWGGGGRSRSRKSSKKSKKRKISDDDQDDEDDINYREIRFSNRNTASKNYTDNGFVLSDDDEEEGELARSKKKARQHFYVEGKSSFSTLLPLWSYLIFFCLLEVEEGDVVDIVVMNRSTGSGKDSRLQKRKCFIIITHNPCSLI